MVSFILHVIGVFGGAAFGVLIMALAVTSAKADLQIEAGHAQASADMAHSVGDALAAELALHLRRKDFGAASRKRIGDLLLRWGALRPASAPDAPQVERAA